jgi:hypothetical protein
MDKLWDEYKNTEKAKIGDNIIKLLDLVFFINKKKK